MTMPQYEREQAGWFPQKIKSAQISFERLLWTSLIELLYYEDNTYDKKKHIIYTLKLECPLEPCEGMHHIVTGTSNGIRD